MQYNIHETKQIPARVPPVSLIAFVKLGICTNSHSPVTIGNSCNADRKFSHTKTALLRVAKSCRTNVYVPFPLLYGTFEEQSEKLSKE